MTVAQPAFLIPSICATTRRGTSSCNGGLDLDREQRDDGLIALDLPAGKSAIDIRYARTTDQTLGDAVTLLALLILLWQIIRGRERSPLRHR